MSSMPHPSRSQADHVKQPLDLSSLTADYDIVGELEASADSRTYIATRKGDAAKRRDDQTGVLITVIATPDGDEANALTHLAADIKLLARTPHRRLTPVIEGRWLGDDAFAVVTQRTTDPSLAQRLASGETFTNTRIAAILREVNGLLEWAREQKIVHRAVPASGVFLEPGTDRVRVTFAIRPIKRLHRSDAHDDARAIATLATAMLTGDADPLAHEGQTLAELRPDLPERLGEATDALLGGKDDGTAPDVAAYLALIGMADPVAAGEAERERIRTDILEEQRAEREKLAAERAAFEQQAAAERASFERTMAQEREKLEAERTALQKAATREREELQRAVTAERAQLAATRAELERTVAAQRAELERAAARDRQEIAALRESLRAAGEREIERKRQTALEDIVDTHEDPLDDERFVAPTFAAPVLAPLDQLAFDDDSPLMRDDDIVFAPPAEEPTPAIVEPGAPATGTRAPRRRSMILAGSLAAVLVLVGITASVLGSREPAAAPRARAAVSAVAPGKVDSVRVAPAAPVAAAPKPAAAPAAPLPTDSASLRAASRWLDSLREAHPVHLAAPTRTAREVPVQRPATTVGGAAVAPLERSPAVRAAMERARAEPRTPTMADDPFFIPGSAPPPHRDTVVRRDTARPPDPTTP
jgi:hypothetical protein